MTAATRERGPRLARRPRVAGRLPGRLGARRRRHGPRHARSRTAARRASWTGAGSSASRSRGCVRPGPLTVVELRAAEPAYRAAMARIVPALERRARDRAAGRRRASRGGRPGRLGPCQHGDLRRRSSVELEGGAPRPGRAAGRRSRPGDDGAGEPLGHDPPARLPARVHGRPRPRPVRSRAALGRGRARAAPVRRGEHPPDGQGARTCRSTPFRTWIALHETTHAFEFEAHPWLRPYIAERLERQLQLFGRTPGASAVTRSAALAARCAATATASTGWSA